MLDQLFFLSKQLEAIFLCFNNIFSKSQSNIILHCSWKYLRTCSRPILGHERHGQVNYYFVSGSIEETSSCQVDVMEHTLERTNKECLFLRTIASSITYLIRVEQVSEQRDGDTCFYNFQNPFIAIFKTS